LQLKFELILQGCWTGDHPRTILAKFGLIWFCGFRREDLMRKFTAKGQMSSDEKSSKKKGKRLFQHIFRVFLWNYLPSQLVPIRFIWI